MQEHTHAPIGRENAPPRQLTASLDRHLWLPGLVQRPGGLLAEMWYKCLKCIIGGALSSKCEHSAMVADICLFSFHVRAESSIDGQCQACASSLVAGGPTSSWQTPPWATARPTGGWSCRLTQSVLSASAREVKCGHWRLSAIVIITRKSLLATSCCHYK